MASTSESFQGFRIYDGTYFAYLRIYADRIELEGTEVKTFKVDTTQFHTYHITGQNQNIQVFVDDKLAIDGSGIHAVETLEQIKLLEFGDISGVDVATNGEWDFINYSTFGAFTPSDFATLDFSLEDMVVFSDAQPVAIKSFVDPSNGEESLLIGSNPFDESKAGRLHIFNPAKSSEFRRTKSVTASSVNSLLIQEGSKFIGTEYGLSLLEGFKADPFTKTALMDVLPSADGFKSETNLSGTIASVNNGVLTIDVTEAGNFFFKQDELGSEWVEFISNADGWTFETRFKISSLTASSTLASGIVLNDGTRTETVLFGPGKIQLKNAGLTHSYTPTSDFVQVRITGMGEDIFVYFKNLTDIEWTLVIDGTGKFTTPSTDQGSSQFPDIAIESTEADVSADNKIHMVWHDNKDGVDQIFHSSFDGTSFTVPVRISIGSSAARQPSIAIDSLKRRHVVYQRRIGQHVQVFHVLHDGQTWRDPVQITQSTGDAENAKVKVDSGNNVHVVWQDSRFVDGDGTTEIMYGYKQDNTGKWFTSAFGVDDTRITESIGESLNPTIEINTKSVERADGTLDVIDEVFLAWQDNQSDSRFEIFSTNFRYVKRQSDPDAARTQTSALSIEGYWDLNGDTFDGTTNFNRLNNASVTFTTGMIGSGALFDSTEPSSIYINHDFTTGLDMTEDFTIAAWVKPTAHADYTIVSKRDDSGVGPYSMKLIDSSGIGVGPLLLEGKIAGTDGTVVSTVAIPPGIFSHVAFEYITNNDDGEPELRLFVDGEPRGSKVISTTSQSESTTPFVIGGTPPSSDDIEPEVPVGKSSPIVHVIDPFSGVIDEVYVFSGPLSEAEIREIMDDGSTNLNDVDGKTGPVLLRTDVIRITNNSGNSENPHLAGSKFLDIPNTFDKINLVWQDTRDRTTSTDTRTEIYHVQYGVSLGKWSSSGQFSGADTRVTKAIKQSINPRGISTPTSFITVWQDDRDKANTFNLYEAIFTLSSSSWQSSGQGEFDIKIDPGTAGGDILPAITVSTGSEKLWVAYQSPITACDIALSESTVGDFDEDTNLTTYFSLDETGLALGTPYDNIIDNSAPMSISPVLSPGAIAIALPDDATVTGPLVTAAMAGNAIFGTGLGMSGKMNISFPFYPGHTSVGGPPPSIDGRTYIFASTGIGPTIILGLFRQDTPVPPIPPLLPGDPPAGTWVIEISDGTNDYMAHTPVLTYGFFSRLDVSLNLDINQTTPVVDLKINNVSQTLTVLATAAPSPPFAVDFSSNTFALGSASVLTPTAYTGLTLPTSGRLFDVTLIHHADGIFSKVSMYATELAGLPTTFGNIRVDNVKKKSPFDGLPLKNVRFGVIENGTSKILFDYIRFRDEAIAPANWRNIVGEQCGLTGLLGSGAVNDMAEFSNGRILVATNYGVSIFDPNGVEITCCEFSKGTFQSINSTTNNLTTDEILTVAVDKLDVIYLGIGQSIITSTDLETFTTITSESGLLEGPVNAIVFDADNKGWFGTSTGLSKFDGEKFINYTTDDGLPSNFIEALAVDSENNIWIGTNAGISRFNNTTFLNYSIPDGLSGRNIRDIAIDDDNFVWAATENGVSKFKGSSFEIIRTTDGLASNNAFTIGIDTAGDVWVGTDRGLSQIRNRIEIDSIVNYIPNSILPTTSSAGSQAFLNEGDLLLGDPTINSFKIYRVIGGPWKKDSAVNVYVNGNLFRGEFIAVPDEGIIQFAEPRDSTDIISMVIFNNLKLVHDFTPNQLLRTLDPGAVPRIKTITKFTNSLVAGVTERLLIGLTSSSELWEFIPGKTFDHPVDSIVLDSTPPFGSVEIGDFLDSSTAEINLAATDNLTGVQSVQLSQFDNFTTDGLTEAPFELFAERKTFTFNVGSDPEKLSLDIDPTDGEGQLFHVHDNVLYAATTRPGKIFKFVPEDKEWELVFSTGEDDIFAMESFRGDMYIGTGPEGKIFKFDGSSFDFFDSLAVSNILSFEVFLNNLYIGTGTDGIIYKFDGTSFIVELNTLEESIYDLKAFGSFLYAATGEDGHIYRFNLKSWDIIHTNNNEVSLRKFGILTRGTGTSPVAITDDALAEIAALSGGTTVSSSSTTRTLFVGGGTKGRILRFNFAESIWTKSFESVPNVTHSMQGIDNAIYAAIDGDLFKFSDNNWEQVMSVVGAVKDIVKFNDIVYVITTTQILILDQSEEIIFNIFARFKDAAGNITQVFDNLGAIIPQYTDSINVSDLPDEESAFTLSNRIFEIDGSSISFTHFGTEPFLAGDEIAVEKATYESEKFNGTDSLVAYDRISWTEVLPDGTDIEIFVKNASTKAGLDDAELIGPFIDFDGTNDLSSLSKPWIQFIANLTSTVAGSSPSLRDVTITARAADAVHFFTTNFSLPSRIKRGLLALNNVKPVNTDIKVGIDTNSSTDFSDYQIIDPCRVFELDDVQNGTGLKVGVKLISTESDVPVVDEFALQFELEDGAKIQLNN